MATDCVSINFRLEDEELADRTAEEYCKQVEAGELDEAEACENFQALLLGMMKIEVE